MLENKILMITGGTGSFGKTVLKRFLKTNISQIIIFSRDEKKQEDLRVSLNDSRVKFILGDVRSYDSLKRSMFGIDYVFHAAALKQVPSCEFFPMETVQTNINGTNNVIQAAIENNVKRLVFLSTDKAVYPINAMGISKAMAEKVLIARSREISESGLILSATRYGNVMASRGSVIPLFTEKIMSGEPLTITDPKMTRFLMSLEDSVDLVLQAFEKSRQGDIFVQKAPACTISTLAAALQEIFDVKSKIKIIGTRHGEKLYESLVSREEMAKVEDLDNWFRIPADNRDLNYDKYILKGVIEQNEITDYTSHNTTRLNIQQVKKLLLSLEYIQKALIR